MRKKNSPVNTFGQKLHLFQPRKCYLWVFILFAYINIYIVMIFCDIQLSYFYKSSNFHLSNNISGQPRTLYYNILQKQSCHSWPIRDNSIASIHFVWTEPYKHGAQNRTFSNISRQTQMFLVSSCSCLCPIQWSQVLGREWRCSWSSADRRCSNYIWVIENFIGY